MGGYSLSSFIERMPQTYEMRQAGTQKISGVAALRIDSTFAGKKREYSFTLSPPLVPLRA
jgi:hypothetical protein